MLKLFKRKSTYITPGSTEMRFQAVVDLVKDLPKADFNKVINGAELVWQGYEKIRAAKTREEKENEEINQVEKEIGFIGEE